MNDQGDFYIGNTKISADSGEQITFDIPVPTVTGEAVSYTHLTLPTTPYV